jgi:hypothetical protein
MITGNGKKDNEAALPVTLYRQGRLCLCSPVRSPHHGASGEATRPQGVLRVSCAAARRVSSRDSLTSRIAGVNE